MKIICISDTHNQPLDHPIPDGDVLIHAGDATIAGTPDEIFKFRDWFLSFPHKHKIFVPGNHDWLYFRDMPTARRLLECLHDEPKTIEGIKFYASAWQPEFGRWAFGLPRGEAMKHIWAKIPDDTDVLITHTPPKHFLDANGFGVSCGCEDLFNRVKSLKLKLHVFGHIHESYGLIEVNGTKYVNASLCDAAYIGKHNPIVVEI